MIGDDIAAALPELRAQAESRMDSLTRVDLDDGLTDPDPVTGKQDRIWTPVYEGKCRWKVVDGQVPTTVVVAGTPYTYGRLELHLPADESSSEVRPATDRRFRATALTASAGVPAGRVVYVVADHWGDDITARRLGCAEV